MLEMQITRPLCRGLKSISMEVLFWKSDLALAVLSRAKDALISWGMSFEEKRQENLTFRFLQKTTCDDLEDLVLSPTSSTISIIIGETSRTNDVRRILTNNGYLLESSSEIELILSKTHEGSVRTRQTVIINVTRLFDERKPDCID